MKADNIKKLDKEMMSEFKSIVLIDDAGKAYDLKLVFGTDDRALALLGSPEQIYLPLANIFTTHYDKPDGCNLRCHYIMNVVSLYREEMFQIMEQVLAKFSPNCKTSINNYDLKLNTIACNSDYEHSSNIQLHKFSFDFTLTA